VGLPLFHCTLHGPGASDICFILAILDSSDGRWLAFEWDVARGGHPLEVKRRWSQRVASAMGTAEMMGQCVCWGRYSYVSFWRAPPESGKEDRACFLTGCCFAAGVLASAGPVFGFVSDVLSLLPGGIAGGW
jgi:hypothetical protein